MLTDLLRRHPEIHDIELEPPIIVAGLPRTGTTHLHNLMAADPAFRTLPYWESIEPYPLPPSAALDPDPRRARTDAAVEFMNRAMPHFERMHEMTTDHVHEEIQLLAVDFSTMLFETIAHVPAWVDYYRAHDQTPHYRYLRTVLQALQHERGGGRWVLKSPQHLEQLARAGRGVPRRHDRRHPPRPGGGRGVDGDDARLHRPHDAAPVDPHRHRPGLGRPARVDARRLRPRPRRCSDPSARSTSGSTSSWPTTSAWCAASTSWRTRHGPNVTERVLRALPGRPPPWAPRRGRLRPSQLGARSRRLATRFAPYIDRFLS